MQSPAHRVVALLTRGASPFELGVVCEVFGLERPELGVPWYTFQVVAGEVGPLCTSVGFVIDTPYGLERLPEADTVIITAWHDIDRTPPADLLRALQAAHSRGARMVSVCSGAFLLAAAGLLDGRRATTHWRFAADLARRYPKIEVDPRVLYIDDGDVLTSAGTAAGIDLCLHIVRRDYGSEVANAVARRMVIAPQRSGGQAQYIELPVPRSQADDLSSLRDWMLERLAEDDPLEVLAARMHVSTRTLLRRFRSSTGATPHRWLMTQRLLFVTQLLETTDRPIAELAESAGFGTPANLRQHFRFTYGVAPAAYRRAFRRHDLVGRRAS